MVMFQYVKKKNVLHVALPISKKCLPSSNLTAYSDPRSINIVIDEEFL